MRAVILLLQLQVNLGEETKGQGLASVSAQQSAQQKAFSRSVEGNLCRTSVVIDIRNFRHGQLPLTFSRVRAREDITVCVPLHCKIV
jgi:hypothetical protein